MSLLCFWVLCTELAHSFSVYFPKDAQFSRSLKLLTSTLFACWFNLEKPNCTSQNLVHQKARMLAYILVPNLTYSEQIYYIKNVCKNKEFLKHFSVWHFSYTGQCMDKVSQSHFSAVTHVTEKWKKMVGRIRVNNKIIWCR